MALAAGACRPTSPAKIPVKSAAFSNASVCTGSPTRRVGHTYRYYLTSLGRRALIAARKLTEPDPKILWPRVEKSALATLGGGLMKQPDKHESFIREISRKMRKKVGVVAVSLGDRLERKRREETTE